MRKGILTIVIGIIIQLPGSLNGQPLAWFTQYRENYGMVNPAALNSDFFIQGGAYPLSFGVSYRQESSLQKYDYIPRIGVARLEYVMAKNGFDGGVHLLTGAYAVSDRFGASGYETGHLRLAGFFPLDERTILSVGLSGGLGNFRFDGSVAQLQTPNDPLEGARYTQLIYQAGAGFFMLRKLGRRHDPRNPAGSNDLFGGFSLRNLVTVDLERPDSTGHFSTKVAPEYYGLLGGYFYVNDFDFFETSLWFKSIDGIPWHLDLNVRYQFTYSLPFPLWIGAGVGGMDRSGARSLHLEMGVLPWNANQGVKSQRTYVKIGFGYDIFLSTLPGLSSHALELNMNVLPWHNR